MPAPFLKRVSATGSGTARTGQGYGPVVGRLLIVLCCYFFLSGLMQSLVSIRGVAVGLSGSWLGLTLGLASGSLGLLLDMPIAQAADDRGKLRIVGAGLACFLAASALLLVSGRAALFAGAFLAGLGAIATGEAVLAWLGSATPVERQARLQGINGSVQRFGALIAAGVVGIAIAVRQPGGMALAGAAVSAVALVAGAGAVMRRADIRVAEMPARLRVSYMLGLRKLSRKRIMLAGLINLAINVIFLETNSYVPLVMGPDRALVVSGALAARDIAAVASGLLIASAGVDMASPLIASGALAIAGIATWMCSYLLSSPLLIALGAVQGAVVGVSIAATNLFTINATTARERTLAMAATLFPSRIMLLLLPIGCSLLLKAAGLAEVFRLLSVVLAMTAVAMLALGKRAPRPAPAPDVADGA